MTIERLAYTTVNIRYLQRLGQAMAIDYVHSYLVKPGKKSGSVSKINGTTLTLSGRLFDLLNDIYERSEQQCDIAISFNQGSDGAQQNDCRDLFISYLDTPNLARGRKIAERLESVTTHRSGLGLLFVITGTEGNQRKLVVSRFPTDVAILAEEKSEELNVEFLERVFMKSANSYKAAVYRDSSLRAGFWRGRAVDRQINDSVTQVSAYWISEFLASDLDVTAAAGTRKFAIALRNVVRDQATALSVKNEIAAAVTLAKSLKGKKASVLGFEKMMNLSKQAQTAINAHLPNFLDEPFQLDWSEFSDHLAFRSIELDNGGMLTAEAQKFDEVFHAEKVDAEKTRYTTAGRVVGERLGKSKIERLGR